MAVAVVYFIGAGVFNFGGVDIEHGKPLPAEVPPETVKKMIENGKASTTPPAAAKASGNELGALRDKVSDLTAQLSTVTGERDKAQDAATRNSTEIIRLQGELSTVTGERDKAQDALKQAQATIEEMTRAQLNATTPAPAVPAEAGPAKK